MEEEAKNALINQLCSLSDDDWAGVIKASHKSKSRSSAIINNVCNYIKRSPTAAANSGPSQPRPPLPQNQPPPTKVITHPGGQQYPAWKVGCIFRGDKIPLKGHVFVDVENVTLKPAGLQKHRPVAATVAIVTLTGKLVLWCFVFRDQNSICTYSPKLTKLQPEPTNDEERKEFVTYNYQHLNNGIPESMLHIYLDKIQQSGSTIVGWGLKGDLEALNFNWTGPKEELQEFYRDSQPFALETVVKKLLSNRSGFQKGAHSAIDDSRMTAAVYKQMLLYKDQPAKWDLDFKKLQATRVTKRPKVFPGDACKCKEQDPSSSSLSAAPQQQSSAAAAPQQQSSAAAAPPRQRQQSSPRGQVEMSCLDPAYNEEDFDWE